MDRYRDIVNLMTHEQCNSYIGFMRLLKFKTCVRLLDTDRAREAYNAVASAKSFIDAYVATFPYGDVTIATNAIMTDVDIREYKSKCLKYGLKLLHLKK